MSSVFFLWRGTCIYAAVATVVAHACNVSRVVDDRGVVNVVDLRDVDVVHTAVVIEVVMIPTATFVTVAEVTESVIDATIETDHRPPIASRKNETLAVPGPVTRSPQVAHCRGFDPRARNPIIIVTIPSPIAGNPNVSIDGADRLLVYGQFRWRKIREYTDPDLCRGNRR